MAHPINISPPKESKPYAFQDEQGFNSFLICRTSDIFEEVNTLKGGIGFNKKVKKQMARYAFYFLYSEKIGRIQGEEFLVTHSKLGLFT